MTPIIDQLNNSGFDFFFLVVDKFLDIKVPTLKNFYSIYDPNLSVKNSGYLLSQPSTLAFIQNTLASSGHRAVIVPFKPSAKIDVICRQNGWIVAANPGSLNRFFEDKIKFLDICQKVNLPTVPSFVAKFSENNFKLYQQKLSQKLVIQTHFGWAGNSSYLSDNYTDLKDKIAPDTLVKFSRFVEGYSLINNCCLTQSGLVQSPPGLQYTGIQPLTLNPLATVGRQWPSFAPASIQNQVKDITIKFSHLLNKYNYRGFFGLDFLVSDDSVYLLECNPRLTASFAFFTDIELNFNLPSLFFLHLAEFINLKSTLYDPFDLPLVGSEINLKDSTGTTAKKYHDFTAFSPTCNPISIPAEIISQVL